MYLTWQQIAQQFRTSLPSFADDMTMYCSSKFGHEACSTVLTAQEALHQALAERGLHVNEH